MYSRDEIKALTDRVRNMAKGDAVEVSFDGGQRSATRWANSSITVNAITTDFWANLDLIPGPEAWKMFGTDGDAKGQPTQTNSISHGSPHIRIKKILVGAAYA